MAALYDFDYFDEGANSNESHVDTTANGRSETGLDVNNILPIFIYQTFFVVHSTGTIPLLSILQTLYSIPEIRHRSEKANHRSRGPSAGCQILAFRHIPQHF